MGSGVPETVFSPCHRCHAAYGHYLPLEELVFCNRVPLARYIVTPHTKYDDDPTRLEVTKLSVSTCQAIRAFHHILDQAGHLVKVGIGELCSWVVFQPSIQPWTYLE